ncbi:MAG: ABC transporter permease [Actinomycetota bacterium]|nr:ABC transporter permease [Actinomycetota bacterium]MDH5314182.1 ABC transporter permease [Actinomycetota bacterium]
MSGLLTKAVRDQRRGLVGWGIAVAAVVAMYAAFFPSIAKSAADLQRYIDNLPEAIRNIVAGEDYSTPIGYLESEFFNTMGPLVVLIFAIGAGSRAIAGEEESGTLDLLLSTPVRRAQVLVTKAAAIVGSAAALAVVAAVSIALFGPPFDLTVPIGNVLAACSMLALLGLAFGGVSFAVGAATGRRTFANAVGGGLAVVTFIVHAVGPTVDWLRPLRPFSPFRWYQDPGLLTGGLHARNVLVLVGIAVVSFAVARIAFDRRDLSS